MFSSKKALVYLVQSFLRSNRSHNNYHVACFSSLSHKNQVGATPGHLNERDTTVEGSEGGYGGCGISKLDNYATEGSRHGGTVYSNIGNKATTTATKDGNEKHGEGRREDMNIEDAARDTAGSMAEMAKAGAVGAMETGLKFGEMAKQTMDNMWNAAKETTENVRDSVADDDDGDDDNQRIQTPNKHPVDKHVEDLRRRAGGYDLKNH